VDTALAEEIAQILQVSTNQTGDNIQMKGNSHDQSTFKQVGKIDATQVSF
jgi:hypothetical protein